MDELTFPPVDLLNPQPPRQISSVELARRAERLEGAICSYAIAGAVVAMRPGPMYTAFTIDLPSGTRVSELRAILPDIARVFAVDEVGLEPVAGSATMNIEIPNGAREVILLRELVRSEAFANLTGALPITLGWTISGTVACFNLEELQHLLVAGTTGSGKSMGLHSVVLSLLFRRGPDQLRLLLIDPKAVEFSPYEGIPHLLAPVLVDSDRAARALKWVVGQMDDRFRLMAALGVRNIDAFNLRVQAAREAGQPLHLRARATRDASDGFDGTPGSQELHPLPRLVVIIDEVGDLMTTAFDEIDPMLQLLARRGHVAGIHLVLSTERPSTDVLSGAVLANIASRLSYKVVTAAESRIVLDESGAERLARYGDMLLKAAGSNLTRLHGALVADEEILAVADHWRAQQATDYVASAYTEVTVLPDTHEEAMYERALAIVLECDNGSTSHLQRKLRVGYNVAAMLIEQMERRGVVGPPDHVGRREVYEPIDRTHGASELTPPSLAPAMVRQAFRWPWSR